MISDSIFYEGPKGLRPLGWYAVTFEGPPDGPHETKAEAIAVARSLRAGRLDSGIEELRRIVRAADMTRESAFDGFDPAEVINIIRACWESPWDLLPDELMAHEREHAAEFGTLSPACRARLDRELGGAS